MALGVIVGVGGPIIAAVSMKEELGGAIVVAIIAILLGAFYYWFGSGIYHRKRGRIMVSQVFLVVSTLGSLTSGAGGFIAALIANAPRFYYYSKRMDEFE